MKYLSLILLSSAQLSFAAKAAPSPLTDRLKGEWRLTSVTCEGVSQKLENENELRFDGKTGAYVSKNKTCTQIEPEIYEYVSPQTVTIKAGVRKCDPTPCAADLAATECGKETNPATVPFAVSFDDKTKTMILSTSDPKSVDCIGPGQSKPAVFTFQRKGK